MIKFEFATASRIIFGSNVINQLPDIASSLGGTVLIVAGRRRSVLEQIKFALEQKVDEIHTFHVTGEPTVEMVQAGRAIALENSVDLVIGFGGGSAIDTAKAIAALATNRGDIYDYLEVIGKNQPLHNPPLPIIAVPTTSGTGTEVTRNAVISSKAHHRKVSLRHALLIPRIALIDPELTLTMPPDVTAYTGMDALTQLIEPYVSHYSTPMTDCLCRDGIRRGGPALIKAYDDGNNIQAREDMALASLYGGIALTNANLGAVHGIAGPFGGMYDAPHGAVCGRLLPVVMKVNIEAIQTRDPDNSALARYGEIARWMTGNERAHALDGANYIAELVDYLGLPGLGSYGLDESGINELVDKSHASSSMRGNPIRLTRDEIRLVLEEAF